MVYEKPSWWLWMRRSYYYAFRHQQWKPVEYIQPAQMLASASGPLSAASQQSGGGLSAIAGCPTVDKTKPLLDLWQRLPERRGEGPPSPLFQFVDGERGLDGRDRGQTPSQNRDREGRHRPQVTHPTHLVRDPLSLVALAAGRVADDLGA